MSSQSRLAWYRMRWQHSERKHLFVIKKKFIFEDFWKICTQEFQSHTGNTSHAKRPKCHNYIYWYPLCSPNVYPLTKIFVTSFWHLFPERSRLAEAPLHTQWVFTLPTRYSHICYFLCTCLWLSYFQDENHIQKYTFLKTYKSAVV